MNGLPCDNIVETAMREHRAFKESGTPSAWQRSNRACRHHSGYTKPVERDRQHKSFLCKSSLSLPHTTRCSAAVKLK